MWKSIQCMFFWQESLKHLFQFSQSSPNCKADYFSPLLCSVVRYWSQIGKNHSLIEKLFNHPERSLKEGGKSRSEAFVFYLLYPQWLKITGKVAFKIKRAKRAKLIFWVDKSWLKMPKMVQFVFWKSEACGQTVLPDRSVLIGQKLTENANFQKWCFRKPLKSNVLK